MTQVFAVKAPRSTGIPAEGPLGNPNPLYPLVAHQHNMSPLLMVICLICLICLMHGDL